MGCCSVGTGQTGAEDGMVWAQPGWVNCVSNLLLIFLKGKRVTLSKN